MGMSNLGRNLFSFPDISKGQLETLTKLSSAPLNATSNISYLEFIEIVKTLWEQGYPDIPVVPIQTGTYAKYPAIVYALESRYPVSSEKKARQRPNNGSGDPGDIIMGQQFHNIVSFSVLTRANNADIVGDENPAYKGAEVADRIIEIFEDFMYEYTPVFKAFGAVDFTYFKRISDVELNRDSIDVNKRTVTYMLRTEKQSIIKNSIINKIEIDIRTYFTYEQKLLLEQYSSQATPNWDGTDVNIIDLFQSATPNF